MTREQEIADIERNQLSHETDLPRVQIMQRGVRVDIEEIPYSNIPTGQTIGHNGENSIQRLVDRGGLPVGVTPYSWLPEEERTYIRGTEKIINEGEARRVLDILRGCHARRTAGRTGGAGDYGRLLFILSECRGWSPVVDIQEGTCS